jgi:hypothetical protein
LDRATCGGRDAPYNLFHQSYAVSG